MYKVHGLFSDKKKQKPKTQMKLTYLRMFLGLQPPDMQPGHSPVGHYRWPQLLLVQPHSQIVEPPDMLQLVAP